MHHRLAPKVILTVILLSLVATACATVAPSPTSTPQPTATITLTPTITPKPSFTPKPTQTPYLTGTARAATQKAEEQAEIQAMKDETQKYFDLGYIATTDGTYRKYSNFNEEWAQLGWYQWWILGDKATDFYMTAHVKWSSAYRNADVSGCGFVFAVQENNDHYAAFLDRSVVEVLSADQSSYTRRLGKTRGTGRVNFNNPADEPVEADFTVIVNDGYLYVIVDEEVVGEYTLAESRNLDGNLGLTLLSGTNKDFGTRCEMTKVHAWIAK